MEVLGQKQQLNTARRLKGSGTGTSTASFLVEVTPPNTLKNMTESWNGSDMGQEDILLI